MSSIDSSWVLLVGLALFVGWLGWTLLRSRKGGPKAKDADAVPPPQPEVPVDDAAIVVAPDPAPAAPPAAPPAPVSPTAAAPGTADPPAQTRSRPPPLRIERVLAIEPAEPGAEADTVAVPLFGQAGELPQALATAVRASDDAATRASGTVAIRLPADAALAIARLDAGSLRVMAAANEAANERAPRQVLHWLDSVAAAELAASVLAVHAGESHLRSLVDEVQDLKSTLAALPAKALGGHEAGLKSLLQDLARYARDARDNYVGLVGRATFRERVGDAGARAEALWSELAALDAERRRALDTLSSTSRFGEVQVEKARSLLHEHRQAQRVHAIVGRTLAALGVMRLVLGESSQAHVDALTATARSLRDALEHDEVLRQRLQAAEAAARGDPYVGRGEFEASRAAVRKLLDGLGSDLVATEAQVAAAAAAGAAGFPAPPIAGWLCVLRVAEGTPPELRVRALGTSTSSAAEQAVGAR